MSRSSNILMAAAIGLAAVGTGVAIVQPGDMGDDKSSEQTDVGPDVASDDDPVVDGDDPVIDDADTDNETDDGTGSQDAGDTSSIPTTSRPDDPTTTAPSTTAAPESTTTSVGSQSGMDADGPATPKDTADGLADTGGQTMVLAGVALGAAGIVVRRRTNSR